MEHSTVSSQHEITPEEKTALSKLKAGHFKEAIELYKQLLQTENKEQWRQRLAYCYLQTAHIYAARGIYKEALLLWANYSRYAQPPYKAYDHYISWLLQTNDLARVQSCLEHLTAQQLDTQYAELTNLLGLLMLTEHPELQHTLARDSVFIAHFKLAQSAMLALQADKPDQIHENLNSIPYRSAFRDFRTLLKAFLSMPQDVEQARSLLVKIPSESAYAQTAGLLLTCTQRGSRLAHDLQQMNFQQSRIIAEIKGLNRQQLEFADQLSTQIGHLSDKQKLNLAIQYKSLCNTEFTQQLCHALLISYPAGRRIFNKNFTSVDKFEDNRLKALASERNNNVYEADYYWNQCIALLKPEDTDYQLKTALILRHIATLKEDTDSQVQLLIDSLHYDPEDRDVYLQILKHSSHQQDTSGDYDEWLTRTLDKFPDDMEVLNLAIRHASKYKAVNKAGLYAEKLLNIDPLNTLAKQTLFTSHLVQARKLIKDRQYQQAKTEIQLAEKLNLGKKYSVHYELLQGLALISKQHKKQGLERVTQSLHTLNFDPVNAYFQGAMEALLTGLSVAETVHHLAPTQNHILSAQALTRLNQLIKQYSKEGDNEISIHQALENIAAVIKYSMSTQHYDEKELLAFCQTLDHINHFDLLRHCSCLAQERWNKPMWAYYRVHAESDGMPERCTAGNISELMHYQQLAKSTKDQRALVLINNFLDLYDLSHPHQSMGLLDQLFHTEDKENSVEDPIEILFNHIPEITRIKLNNQLNSLTEQTTPEQLVEELTTESEHSSTLLQAMMEQPDLYTALMIIKAAQTLEIDIDVNSNTVFRYFNVPVHNDPATF